MAKNDAREGLTKVCKRRFEIVNKYSGKNGMIQSAEEIIVSTGLTTVKLQLYQNLLEDFSTKHIFTLFVLCNCVR